MKSDNCELKNAEGKGEGLYALKKFKKGDVILKCEGFTTQVVTDIAEVRDQLLAELEEQKVQEAVANLFDQLKKDSYVHNFWTGEVTGQNQIRQASGSGSPRGAVQQAGGARR